jgi:two-component system OmpR family sensor kinase
VYGRQHLLRQLLNNLIDNALKYTHHHSGKINVNLTADSEERVAVLTVEDNGVGIAPEDVPHVFDRFFRADKSRTRLKDTAGTGLGLSLCKAIVAAHNGEIFCQSTLGKGTLMTVRIPLAPSSEQLTAVPMAMHTN